MSGVSLPLLRAQAAFATPGWVALAAAGVNVGVLLVWVTGYLWQFGATGESAATTGVSVVIAGLVLTAGASGLVLTFSRPRLKLVERLWPVTERTVLHTKLAAALLLAALPFCCALVVFAVVSPWAEQTQRLWAPVAGGFGAALCAVCVGHLLMGRQARPSNKRVLLAFAPLVAVCAVAGRPGGELWWGSSCWRRWPR